MNVSSPLGTTSWFNGNTNAFPAYKDTGYIAADFHNTTGTGTISNWLASPVRWMHNGDQIIFSTRKTDSSGNDYPDRLQVWLSTIGASSYFSNNDSTTGSYSIKLLDIDSTYTNDSYHGGYPYDWKRYVLTLSGLPSGQISCRFAFRYYATNAGPNGTHSGYIGIDSLAYVTGFNGVPEQENLKGFNLFPNPSNGIVRISMQTGSSGERNLTVIDIMGQKVMEKKCLGPEIELDLRHLSKGLYIININDENGLFSRKLIIQ